MAMVPAFFDLLNWEVSISPEQHYQANNLSQIFHHRIARSRATGKDGIRVGRFEENLAEQVAIIEQKIAEERYAFTGFKQRLILKGAEKLPRQISIPTVRDRLVLRAVCQMLHNVVPQSTGYAPHAVVDQVATHLRSEGGERSFIRIDVKDFFPSIRHDRLLGELIKFDVDATTRRLCMNAVGTKTGNCVNRPTKGVPQGLSISGALACIYMLRFDDRQLETFGSYFRYVDDILLIRPTSSAHHDFARVRRSLGRLGLSVHSLGTTGKTEIKNVTTGIDYLGYHIDPHQISIRSTSFHRMFNNILKVITDYRYRNDVNRLIFRLNLKISGCQVDTKRRGWMMFFSRTENLKQLSHLDQFVRQQLRRVNLPDHHFPSIKKFIKSYHEIRYNINDTSYVPNFDNYDLTQKIGVVSTLMGRPLAEVESFSIETIEQQFRRLIGQEVQDLEHDVGNPS